MWHRNSRLHVGHTASGHRIPEQQLRQLHALRSVAPGCVVVRGCWCWLASVCLLSRCMPTDHGAGVVCERAWMSFRWADGLLSVPGITLVYQGCSEP